MTVRVGEQRRSFVGCRRLFVGCRRLLVVVVLSSFVGLFFVRWLSVVVVVRRLRRSLFVVRCSLFVVRYCRLSPFVRSLFIVDYLFVCLWLLLLSPSSIVVVHCRRPWSSSNVVVQCRRPMSSSLRPSLSIVARRCCCRRCFVDCCRRLLFCCLCDSFVFWTPLKRA